MLHFDLKVNDQVIGRVEIVNQHAHIPADRMCTYDVEMRQFETAVTAAKEASFTIRHNYDEGPFELVRKALVHFWVDNILDGELA
jgi:hypothetical protein